jgi:hypothetical protein
VGSISAYRTAFFARRHVKARYKLKEGRYGWNKVAKKLLGQSEEKTTIVLYAPCKPITMRFRLVNALRLGVKVQLQSSWRAPAFADRGKTGMTGNRVHYIYVCTLTRSKEAADKREVKERTKSVDEVRREGKR